MESAASVAVGASRARLSPVGSQRLFVLGCESARGALEAARFLLRPLEDTSAAGLAELTEADAPLVLVGLGSAGEDVSLGTTLQRLRERAPLSEVCVWAPEAAAALVRDALRGGASEVVLDAEPRAVVEALLAILRGAERDPSQREAALAGDEDAAGGPTPPDLRAETFEGMISTSPTMFRLFETCQRVAPTEATVLLLGETGTGKELLARAIHKHSGRPGRFVAVNCGAVSETLIESELFGHEKGSFTGATGAKSGLFRHAHQGTLLLDEVGDLPHSAQLSLLRVLQEGKVRPVGGSEEIPVDVRVIAATSVPLYEKVEQGRFREDLLYRVDVIRLVVPPLRDRRGDVTHLFGQFCARLGEQHAVELPRFNQSFNEAMQSYRWPGNVRQLENFTERLLLTRPASCLTAMHFRELIRPYRGDAFTVAGPAPAEYAGRPEALAVPPLEESPLPDGDVTRTLEDFLVPVCTELERRYLHAALRKNEGRLQATANTAGLSRRTLQRKLKKHGIDRRDFR